MMDFAGMADRGGSDDAFVSFTPAEVKRHVMLYIAQALNPIPTLSQKMYCQTRQAIQGND